MSIKFMNWAFGLEGLTPFQKVLILALSDNANDDGTCWPSIGLLSKKTGIKSKTTIRSNIKEMVEKGLLKKVARNRDNGSKTSNKYILSGSVNDLARVSRKPTPLPDVDPLYEPPIEPSIEPSLETSVELENKQKENPIAIAKPEQAISPNYQLGSFEQALSHYGALAEKYGLRIPRVVSAKNEQKTRKILKMLDGLGSNWVEYMRIIARSPHLIGKNDRGWKITFDWIINPANFEKIFNGIYEVDQPHKGAHKGAHAQPTEAQKWSKRLIGLIERGFWIDGWGERPGIDGCQVPIEILKQHGMGGEILKQHGMSGEVLKQHGIGGQLQ